MREAFHGEGGGDDTQRSKVVGGFAPVAIDIGSGVG